MTTSFNVPSTIVAGTGAVDELPAQLQRRGLNRVLLVTDAFMVSSGLARRVAASLAAAGVDTLTHGIEAYVSRQATTFTDPLALSCIRLVGEHLETGWREPLNRTAREGMMLAATHGGMAFANSSVALVHGMSRPIGALFHVPHGVSNAMLLPTVTRFSISGATDRYATVALTMGWSRAGDSGAAAANALVAGLEDLNRRLEVPRLRDHPRIDEVRFRISLEKMALDALASGSPQNNPVVPTAEQIVELSLQA